MGAPPHGSKTVGNVWLSGAIGSAGVLREERLDARGSNVRRDDAADAFVHEWNRGGDGTCGKPTDVSVVVSVGVRIRPVSGRSVGYLGTV